MKKIIYSLLLACGVASAALAQDTNSSTVSLFKGNELALPLGFNYNDAKDAKFAPVIGVTYFITKNLGVRGTTTINVQDATAFDNADLLVLARLPIYAVAPYIGGGARFQASAEDKWSPILVGGVEVRLNKKWGLFAEARHDFDGGENINYKDWSFRGGVNLVLW